MQHRLQCEAGRVRLFNFIYVYEVFLRPLEDAGLSAGRKEAGELKITFSHFLFIQINAFLSHMSRRRTRDESFFFSSLKGTKAL